MFSPVENFSLKHQNLKCGAKTAENKLELELQPKLGRERVSLEIQFGVCFRHLQNILLETSTLEFVCHNSISGKPLFVMVCSKSLDTEIQIACVWSRMESFIFGDTTCHSPNISFHIEQNKQSLLFCMCFCICNMHMHAMPLSMKGTDS